MGLPERIIHLLSLKATADMKDWSIIKIEFKL